MPFNPFTSVTGRNALTLFDIRLENDFLVFRGNEHEASGQLLKGVVAICVPSPIKIEDIHLRLTGIQRLAWTDPKVTPSGLTSTKVDRTNVILQHQWAPFWGTPGKSAVLEKGNYEFPFELMLPGDTCESIEGIHEANITYKLKATIARGKLAYDLHAYKHLRIVRTLESSALEFLHAMSVENIWPNKVEYSIVVPQKAVVFGSHIPLEARFTPLLKGLELGDITLRLMEIQDLVSMPPTASGAVYNYNIREYKHERLVSHWTVGVTREEHWQEMIEDTGQEGWVVKTTLDLPRKLGKCLQDVNVHGIKIRHKLKMVVALKNPDGHISELRATLPLTIFISPNIPLDEHGNLTCPSSHSTSSEEMSNIAPPGYGEHVLDQLYDEVDVHNLQTPAPMSAVHSPLYNLSRAGSSENLPSMAASMPVPPAALTSRLQDVSAREAAIRRSNRNSAVLTPPGSSSDTMPFSPMHLPHHFMHRAGTDTLSPSEPISRRNSGESRHSDHSDPEHIDFPDLTELCKVPSYATAMKNPRVGPIAVGTSLQLPDYNTAASEPNPSRASSVSVGSTAAGPARSTCPTVVSTLASEPLSVVAETPQETAATQEADVATTSSASSSSSTPSNSGQRSRAATYQSDHSSTSSRRHQLSAGVPFIHLRHVAPANGDVDERSWLHLLQARGRVTT